MSGEEKGWLSYSVPLETVRIGHGGVRAILDLNGAEAGYIIPCATGHKAWLFLYDGGEIGWNFPTEYGYTAVKETIEKYITGERIHTVHEVAKGEDKQLSFAGSQRQRQKR